MNFSSKELREDYHELLEELKDIISNLTENPSDTHHKKEYEEILREIFNDFKKPHIFQNQFKINEMVRIVNYPYQKKSYIN